MDFEKCLKTEAVNGDYGQLLLRWQKFTLTDLHVNCVFIVVTKN